MNALLVLDANLYSDMCVLDWCIS